MAPRQREERERRREGQRQRVRAQILRGARSPLGVRLQVAPAAGRQEDPGRQRWRHGQLHSCSTVEAHH